MAEIFKFWNNYFAGATNNTKDIGSSEVKFKDLYLSGSIYGNTLGQDLDVNDFDITSIDGLYGVDSNVFIDMGSDGRIAIQADGAGTPFSTPDIDITGSVYFDDDLGLYTDKKVLFRDTTIYIQSGDDGHLDLMADVSIDLNTAANTDLVLNFFGTTNSGTLTWMEDEDYFKFTDDIMLTGGENIILDTATGTKIGTATSQLLGFYNASPVDQPVAVADATGAGDVVAQLNLLLARIRELGLIAT